MLKKIKEFFTVELAHTLAESEKARAFYAGNLSARMSRVEQAVLELNRNVKQLAPAHTGDPFNTPKKIPLEAEKFAGDYVRRVFVDKRESELGIKILLRAPMDTETFNSAAICKAVETALRNINKGSKNEK